jgi:hypothetical protein
VTASTAGAHISSASGRVTSAGISACPNIDACVRARTRSSSVTDLPADHRSRPARIARAGAVIPLRAAVSARISTNIAAGPSGCASAGIPTGLTSMVRTAAAITAASRGH